MTTEIIENEKLVDLHAEVEAGGDVLTVPMRRLRDAYGAGRLGKHVRVNISAELQGLGLGHTPADLPDDQNEQVRLYKLGSDAAGLIEAVRRPSAADDEKIRAATAGGAAEILRRVQELVCDESL